MYASGIGRAVFSTLAVIQVAVFNQTGFHVAVLQVAVFQVAVLQVAAFQR